MQRQLQRLWLQPQHHHIAIGHREYNLHVLPFVVFDAEECIEHSTDNKEEDGLEDNRDNYGASTHGSTHTTLNVLITWDL